MTTIREVAKLAGVSPTTVSHVLNGTRHVRPVVTERVRQAIQVLKYRPNTLARSLRRHETYTLGLLVPDNTNPFFADLARGVEDAGFEEGYSVVLCNSDGDAEKETQYLETLAGKQVDGIVLAATTMNIDTSLLGLVAIPFVLVDRKILDLQVPAILADNYSGGCSAVEHLIGLGHTRIGCIEGPSDVTPSADRTRAYKDALAEAGLPKYQDYIVRGDFHFKSGLQAALQLLGLSERPTAIFATNDLMAIGVLAAVEQARLRVPEDVSVVGFDDIELGTCVNPHLTTIHQPTVDMGRKAVQLLIKLMRTKKAEPQDQVVLPCNLVVRNSTCPPSGRASGG